jgi:NAD(P)-dependent dehydrogenase (short-subunit alcohol dehydrogenase family)
MLLEGKIALVTAGASGMGRAAAELFAREGAHVVVVDLHEANTKETVAGIEAAGGSATGEIVNVRDLDALKALAERVHNRHGKLHVLYNNVGIPGAAGLDLTPEEWDTGLEINARAGFFLSGYLTEALKAGGRDGGASVVFTSSTSGLIGSPYSPMYSFTKGGIVALVRSMALAFAADGIRVNAVAPGTISTEMQQAMVASGRASLERYLDRIPMKRIGRPEELADAVFYLASPQASYISGVVLDVDGGWAGGGLPAHG